MIARGLPGKEKRRQKGRRYAELVFKGMEAAAGKTEEEMESWPTESVGKRHTISQPEGIYRVNSKLQLSKNVKKYVFQLEIRKKQSMTTLMRPFRYI